MRTHEQLVDELMKRPGVKAEVERLEREEGALLDKQIKVHQAKLNSKEIEYTDEPMGDVKAIPDFLPSPADLIAKLKRDIFAEIVEGFDWLEKQRESKKYPNSS
jgi:hypothetical protein